MGSGVAGIFQRRWSLVGMSIAAFSAALSSLFVSFAFGAAPLHLRWGTVLFDVKTSAILWTGGWSLFAVTVLANVGTDTEHRNSALRDSVTGSRSVIALGMGLALIGTDAVLSAIGVFDSSDPGMLSGIGLLCGVVGGAVAAGTVFALAIGTGGEGRRAGEDPQSKKGGLRLLVITAALISTILSSWLSEFFADIPRRNPILPPIGGFLVAVAGAGVATWMVFTALKRSASGRRAGIETPATTEPARLLMAVGFALALAILPNGLLTLQPSLGTGPPALTVVYAAFAGSLGIIGVTLFVAAARKPGARVALTVAASGFVVAMLGEAAMGAFVQLEAFSGIDLSSAAMVATIVTGAGFASHRRRGSSPRRSLPTCRNGSRRHLVGHSTLPGSALGASLHPPLSAPESDAESVLRVR